MESELIPVRVGWQDTFSTFYIELACPNELKGCSSEKIIKHGHDTTVKGHPQHYECKDCQRHFYPHTSGFFSQLEEEASKLMETNDKVIKKHVLDLPNRPEILT